MLNINTKFMILLSFATLRFLTTMPALVHAAGELTMWTDSPTAVQGGSCEYANSLAISGRSTPWLDAYVSIGFYCAVSDDLYKKGVGCGNCYRIEYDASDPNTKSTTTSGSAVVQVVDSSAGGKEHFDCYVEAFEVLTGATTGIYNIGPGGSYAQVDCETTAGPTAVVMDGNNAWYVKILFAGGTNGVAAATIRIGSKIHVMEKVSGATWGAGTAGETDEVVEFDVTYENGDIATIANDCFGGSWPVATGSVCSDDYYENAPTPPEQKQPNRISRVVSGW